MVIGTFQSGFPKKRVEVCRVLRVFEHAGLLDAFVLLDFDQDERMSRSEFEHFVRFCVR